MTVGGKCNITPSKFLNSLSSLRNFTFPVQGRNVLTKAGFTLAEVLITLGIIGVVAAMTIPNLITKIQEKRTVTNLRATHSILAQAIRLAEEEYGEATGWTQENWTSKGAVEIADKLKPFLKIALDCGTSDPNGHCIKTQYKRRNGQYHDVNYATDTRYYKITLLNGTAIWWKSTDLTAKNAGSYISFFVDTNGANMPNQWGEDLFSFSYDQNSLRPSGAPNTVQPYTTHCLPKNSTGYGCAYYVLLTQSMKY